MFSPALGRVIRSTSNIPLSTSTVCSIKRPVVVVSGQQQILTRPSHPHIPQRRFSSSKTSFPPDGSNPSQGTPSDAASKAPTRKTPARKDSRRANTSSGSESSAKRETIKVAKAKSPAVVPQYNVPYILPIQLEERAVKESSFYNLHRPLSPSLLFPKSTTMVQFNQIFKPTSTPLIDGLRKGEDAVLKYSKNNLDRPLPTLSGAFVSSGWGKSAEPETPLDQKVEVLPPTLGRQRTWSTTVFVTESTDASGVCSVSAATTPIIEVESLLEDEQTGQLEIRQPPHGRTRPRQVIYNKKLNIRERPGMLAISVKRQRKLKMKKHKYKKLMKRTRLERKKLGRL